MTPRQEFECLRRLQRELRYIEEEHGDGHGIARARAFLLRLMAALAVALCVVLVVGSALARDDGRYANSPLKDWMRGLKNQHGQLCCDTADGYPAEVEWDTEREHYRVRIDGQWYVVPDEAVLTQPNKLGYPMVWYWRLNDVPQIRCFIPGAGG